MVLYYGGDSSRICYFKESGTYATTSGGALWVGRVTEFTPTIDEGVVDKRYVGGGTRGVQNQIPMATSYTAKMTYEPQDWEMCVYAFGKVTESGTTRHMIDSLNSTGVFPSFTLEEAKVGTATLARTWKGVVVNNMSIEGKEGEFITVSMDLIGQSVTSGTSATAVVSGTTVPYNWSDVKGLDISGTHIAMAGIIDGMKNFKFSVNNDMYAPHYCQGNSRNIQKPIPQKLDFEFDATLNMSESGGALLYKAQSFGVGSEFNADFWICRTGSADTNGNNYMKIWMSGCRIRGDADPMSYEALVEQNIKIKPTTCGMQGTDGNGAYTTFF